MRKRTVGKGDGCPFEGDRLYEAALRYVARFAASREMVRRVLRRRIQRASAAGSIDPDRAEELLASALERLQRAGLIDDNAFARQKVQSHLQQGRSQRHIRSRLSAQGLPPETIACALAGLESDSELKAAIRLAQKRRFGPWRSPDAEPSSRSRELAALGRAGFSFDIALKVIDGTLEALKS